MDMDASFGFSFSGHWLRWVLEGGCLKSPFKGGSFWLSGGGWGEVPSFPFFRDVGILKCRRMDPVPADMPATSESWGTLGEVEVEVVPFPNTW